MDSKKEQIARIQQKIIDAMLTGHFGDAAGLGRDSFRIDVTNYAVGVYGEGRTREDRVRGNALGREFMMRANCLQDAKAQSGDVIYVAGLTHAESLIDQVSDITMSPG